MWREQICKHILVALLREGDERVLTAHGAGLSEIELFVPEEREFTVADGTTVHGWLVRDPDRTGPAPLLLDIHGGPHNAWNGAADPIHLTPEQALAADAERYATNFGVTPEEAGRRG